MVCALGCCCVGVESAEEKRSKQLFVSVTMIVLWLELSHVFLDR